MTRLELEQKVDNFVNTYLGKSNIGFNIPGQCVALCNQYWLDVWGVRFPLQGAGTAYEILSIANNTRPDLFEKVTNNPNDLNQLPSKGDVMIWKNLAGGAGHCAIYLSKGNKVFTSLDENWVPNKVTKETHDWSNVAGWIHNLTQEVVVPPVVPVDPHIKQIADLTAKVNSITVERDGLKSANTKLQSDLEKSVKALADKQKELDDELDVSLGLGEQLKACNVSLSACEKDYSLGELFSMFIKKLFNK